MHTTTPHRFHLTQTRSGVFFTPANDEAKATIPKGRKCLRLWELEAVLKGGAAVEVNFSGYLGGRFWVALTPSNLPAA
jgi:hypothetical protein